MPEPDSTLVLLARARAGEDAALDELFARCMPPLRHWAAGRLPRWARDISDTQDLVQETLLQTFRNIRRFEPRNEGALQAYLRQALMNRIRDEFRRHKRSPENVTIGSALSLNAASPLEEAIGREALDRYEAALQRLREEERAAIIGRVELALGYDSLATFLGKPTPEAARKATQRALLRLAEEMARAE